MYRIEISQSTKVHALTIIVGKYDCMFLWSLKGFYLEHFWWTLFKCTLGAKKGIISPSHFVNVYYTLCNHTRICQSLYMGWGTVWVRGREEKEEEKALSLHFKASCPPSPTTSAHFRFLFQNFCRPHSPLSLSEQNFCPFSSIKRPNYLPSHSHKVSLLSFCLHRQRFHLNFSPFKIFN